MVPTVRKDGRNLLRGAAEQLRCCSLYAIPQDVLQVLNTRANTVHLYNGEAATVCGSWKSGPILDPVPTAEFADSASCWEGTTSVHGFCTQCYSEKGMAKCGATLALAPKPTACGLDSDSASSDVSSSSSGD